MSLPRRRFISASAAAAGWLASAPFGFLSALPRVTAADVQAKPLLFAPEVEPLVRLLEETPRERAVEQIVARIKSGTSYQEILSALLLAGVRNIQPRPIGFKFHAVLVINSAHLASIASPEQDRWLPILWAVDQFKSSQAADVREGNWTLAPVDESAVPASHRAKAALIAAMDQWDESAADSAIAGYARTAGAHDIFDTLCRYGMRDFRELGHKAIYLANSYRTLDVIGWRHAEPVLRSLVYAQLDRVGEKQNPSKADLPADRPYRRNLERLKEIRAGWLDGKADSDATRQMLHALRQRSANDASAKAVELLNKGAAVNSLYDAFFTAAAELVMRAPGISSLHAVTFTNALRYMFDHCRDEETRKLIVLQNAAFIPLYRSRTAAGEKVEIDEFEPGHLEASGRNGIEEIFTTLSSDKLLAARKALAYLKSGSDPKPILDAGRRLVFLKGRDSHDYKFSSAVLEDFHGIATPWRDRFLAGNVFLFRGARESDTDLAQRIRSALG
ncbi:MAG TPA: hypothetical protein VEH27_07185 [Methylomirabilota bacterium]|nr:hypothetical protein [Methylomirabilota bacterium]